MMTPDLAPEHCHFCFIFSTRSLILISGNKNSKFLYLLSELCLTTIIMKERKTDLGGKLAVPLANSLVAFLISSSALFFPLSQAQSKYFLVLREATLSSNDNYHKYFSMDPILGIPNMRRVLGNRNQTPVFHALYPVTSLILNQQPSFLNERDSSKKNKAEETKDKQVSITKASSCYKTP